MTLSDYKQQSIAQLLNNIKSIATDNLEPAFFQTLLGCLEDPVFVKNTRHEWVFANEAFHELIGCNDLIGKTDADFLPADQVQQFYDGDDYVINNQTSLTQEEQVGEECYALVKKIPIYLPDNSKGLFGIIFDISQYRKVQLEVEKLKVAKEQSLSDPLTGLANRRYLDEHYTQLNEKTDPMLCARGILHIDLDHFKEINDTKGHSVGDAVLVNVARVLRNSVRPDDFVARVGGDEFVIIIEKTTEEILEKAAQRVISAFAEPMKIGEEICAVSVSVGIAFDNANQSLCQMLKLADLALYRAKNDGRNRFEHFSIPLLQQHESLRAKRDEFRAGMKDGQFFPFYQPQFDTKTLQITGVEALARWNHPVRGILPPAAFLELAAAERSLIDLDRQIIRVAFSDVRQLINNGYSLPSLSVNVSSQSLSTHEMVDEICGLSPFPNQICVELLESMLLDEPDGIVSDNLARIKDMGISLDIDDFGSGHSSFLGMLEAKPDRVKNDRRLVIPMVESEKHRRLVQSIILIADSLGMQTVAEGVESEQHRQLLLQYNCNVIQGFGFAKPMHLDDLTKLLTRKAA